MEHLLALSGQIALQPILNATEMLFLYSFAAARHDDGPSLRCHWIPSLRGSFLVWDGDPEFDNPEAWMRYLVNHFLKPNAHRSRLPGYDGFTFDHTANGVVLVQEPDCTRWMINVLDNEVTTLPSN